MEQSYIPLRACPVCKGGSVAVIGQLTYALFDDLDIPGTKTLIRCSDCGMMYDDVAFTEDQLQQYYSRNEHYAASSMGGTGSLSADNLNRYDRIIDTVHPDPKGVILDVGCGQGGFAAQCRQRGYSTAGIEPSHKSRKAGLSAGLDIYATMEEYAEKHPETNIRTVVLSHVLEHVLDPTKMLKELARYAPDALVYIEVPDAASYLTPNAIRWHELYFEHLNHFCMDSLSNIAAESGIDVARAASIPFSQDQVNVHCLFIAGRFGRAMNQHAKRSRKQISTQITLPPLPHGDLPQNNGPLALWGISQYAMLLMGSLPQLRRVDRLFDSSPAKIGRKIRGITIEDAKEIGTLSRETALVIPYSQYSQQMRNEIDRSASFKGIIVNY